MKSYSELPQKENQNWTRDILKMKVSNKKSNSNMEKETKLLSIKKTTTFKNMTPKVLKFSAYS